jgi:hypothetical protein
MAQPVLCPSWQCEKGAALLGIVLADGSIAFAKDRIVIDQNFVDAARAGRSPEKRFRFSSTCRQGACVQWKEDRCSVIDQVMAEQKAIDTAPLPSEGELPRCLIRQQCRWHLQSGDSACFACTQVVTDLHEEMPEVKDDLVPEAA